MNNHPFTQVKIRRKPDRRNWQLYYVDPMTGQERTQSAGTDSIRQAERAAARWQAEIESGGANGRISWDGFRGKFSDQRLRGKPKRTRDSYRTAFNYFERIVGHPKYLAQVNESTIGEFQAALRSEGLAETTIACQLRHIKAALRWAARMGMIARAPHVDMPKLDKRLFLRGRPISPTEFEAMLQATPKIVGQEEAATWRHLLCGLNLSGLRLGEAMLASWDSPPVRVDLTTGRYPRWIYHAEGHKARRDELTPLTPDFVEFLQETPIDQREGKIFRPTANNRVVSADVAGRTISAIGKEAGVVVGQGGKTASAHDLRRSFGTRWAMRVRPVTLKALMRHRSIETTLKYYVDLDCDDVGAELWKGEPPR